ncbi:isochorismatase family cysteine hydrolase [Wukongibacter baidiensis]|uniref:cysteine hydrolase family protein n=1 Tax=Wukongibacter baidiensis TaxID=1723361 RepID=UPI003D7F92F6
MSNAALIVIDVQQGLFNKTTQVFKGQELIQTINSLIEKFRDKRRPIIFIRHTNKSILKENSTEWQIHSELDSRDSDVKINKTKSNVFDEDLLPNFLKQNNISTIVITGLVTHGCVKAACLGGIKFCNEVVLVENGHSSFNKKAEDLINEWNKKLEDEGIQVISSNKINIECMR